VHILLIDDDMEVRTAVRTLLQAAGFEVTEADGGEEGVRAFRRRRADLILCDVFMPVKDGLEVIRELRREQPDLKLIAMSGGACGGKMDLLPIARRFGAAAVLYKPFDLPTVLGTIEQVVRTPVPPNSWPNSGRAAAVSAG
jgi:CheY-like chemotaxis protein